MSPATNLRKMNMSVCLPLCFFYIFTVVKADELQILLNISKALHSPNNPNLFSSWTPSNTVCEFHFVTCNDNGSIQGIDLSNQQLIGSLPLEFICKLRHLEDLILRSNSLSGPLSSELRNCISLVCLDLGENLFTGPFPSVSSLWKLKYLCLERNGFSGRFPWGSLRKLTDLLELSVGDNPFEKSLFPTEISGLSNLTVLFMENCSITGEIPPSLGRLKNLEWLALASNYLTGRIPTEIGNLVNLSRLELYNNKLTGKIPVGFGNLTKLQHLDASKNNLEGNLSEIRFLKNLVVLELFKNKFSGEVPPEFGEFRKLVNLSLYMNRLTGPLPQGLGSWSEFIYIDASMNFLTGPIPPDMCKRGTMKKLLLIQNNFSGAIPDSYASCLTLTRLRVNNNSLSGTVPKGIWGLPNAQMIDVAWNRLVGPITSDIGNARDLADLRTNNNLLSGKLPVEITTIESLAVIDLSNNQFSGGIPGDVGDLKSLTRLNLQHNQLNGTLPESVGSCVKLSVLNVAWNSLSGKIPSSLGSLPTMISLNLSNNRISGHIPFSLSSLELNLLDLSNNLLSGSIPQSLLIEAPVESFSGNPGLCSSTTRIISTPKCPSGISKHVIALVVSTGTVALLCLLAVLLFLWKRGKSQHQPENDRSWEMKSFQVLNFTEDEILGQIQPENLIGQGGSGNVYRVVLSTNRGEFAVKQIRDEEHGRRAHRTREFDAEVRTLSSMRHANVVKLYCSITSDVSSFLVYEYLAKGSLWDRLHVDAEQEQLDWNTRYNIALGAAKGLEYLHHGCHPPVIHRDVKSSNILLDEFLSPRIADFGLAKIIRAGGGGDSTHVFAGTYGYFAPECGYTVSEKSDVFSFGVVLLELVTGKRPLEPEFGEDRNIVNWVSDELKSGDNRALSLIDPRIQEDQRECAVKVLRIAVYCTNSRPDLRPTMKTVVQMLEKALPCEMVPGESSQGASLPQGESSQGPVEPAEISQEHTDTLLPNVVIHAG